MKLFLAGFTRSRKLIFKKYFFTLALCLMVTVMAYSQSTVLLPGSIFPSLSSPQRLALSNPPEGMLVFDTSTQTYWFYNATGWRELDSWNWQHNGMQGNEIKNSKAGGLWSANNSNLTETATDLSNPPEAPANGDGTRLMWIPRRSAFRAGTVYGGLNLWDADSIGIFSSAFGFNTTAQGYLSFATGYHTRAVIENNHFSNGNNIAMGYKTVSAGESTISFGNQNISRDGWSLSAGYLCQALSNSSVALGRGSEVRRPGGSVAIGYFAKIDSVSGSDVGHVAIGSAVKASGGGIAIGRVTTATGNGALAMGFQTIASGDRSTALGQETSATGDNSTALGYQSKGIGITSTAIGYQPEARFESSTAIGKNTKALSNEAVAIGVDGTAQAQHSIVLGRGATATNSSYLTYDPGNISIGYESLTTIKSAVAIGSFAKASGRESIAIGYESMTSGYRSCAIGDSTSASDTSAIAMGYHSLASGVYSLAMGNTTVSSGYNAFSLGYKTAASGHSAIAMGNMSQAIGDTSIAIGQGTISSGTISVAMGQSTSSSGNTSTAMGQNTVAFGIASISMGKNTSAFGNYAMGTGQSNKALGNYSTAMGTNTNSNYQQGSFVIGDQISVSDANGGDTLAADSPNRFLARFENGYKLYTDNNLSDPIKYGVFLSNKSNSWSSISDSTKKERFIAYNPENILKSVAAMRVGTWNYKGDTRPNSRHWGVMAQDFYHHFGRDAYGTIGCDTLIATADFDGVNFAAIKALETYSQQLVDENLKLERQLAIQNGRIDALSNLRDEIQSLKSLLVNKGY